MGSLLYGIYMRVHDTTHTPSNSAFQCLGFSSFMENWRVQNEIHFGPNVQDLAASPGNNTLLIRVVRCVKASVVVEDIGLPKYIDKISFK